MNFAAINKYISYLETYDPEEMGVDPDETPFSSPPYSVAEAALMLAKPVDPQEYWRVESAVKGIRWKQKQTSEERLPLSIWMRTGAEGREIGNIFEKIPKKYQHPGLPKRLFL